VHYVTPKGVTCRARVTCLKKDGNVVLLAYAAPESFFASVEPLLQRNLELFGPSSASPLPQQPQHQPLPVQQHQPQQPRAMAELKPLPQSLIDALNKPNSNPWQFKTSGKAFNNMDAYIRDDPPKTKTADIYLYVAPPQLAARAEQVRAHIKASMQLTPRFMQIYQQDEAQIAANGRQPHATQVNWLSSQQTIHRMQTDFGNSIIANYWSHNR